MFGSFCSFVLHFTAGNNEIFRGWNGLFVLFLDKGMKESKQDYQFVGEIMTKHTHIPPFQRNKCTFASTIDIVEINVIHIHRCYPQAKKTIQQLMK